MARVARQTSIDPNQVQVIHVYNRCVRRAFLCGADPLTGKDFEHRRQWARERLEHLASIFAIDCLTFAILSNHTHQILRSRPDIANDWDDREVASRWLRISPKYDALGNPKEPTEYEVNMLLGDATSLTLTSSELSIHDWERLSSATNECSGWLSPIEIDETSDPIGSDPELSNPDSQPFSRRASRKGAVAISLPRYLQLLDWVGRTIRNDKRGSIPPDLAPILSRLGLTGSELVSQMWKFGWPASSSRLNIQPNPAPLDPIPVNTSTV